MLDKGAEGSREHQGVGCGGLEGAIMIEVGLVAGVIIVTLVWWWMCRDL